MADQTGKFVWYELMTSDLDAATRFYGDVVGWGSKDAGVGMPYNLLTLGEENIAGAMTLPQEACDQGAKPGWIGYIACNDVDAYAARVVEKGGKIHKPADDIPGIGRFAIVADPQGAAFCLFRGAGDQDPPPRPMDAVGQVGWHELMSGDLDEAFGFYSSLFGWTKGDAHDMGPMGVYQLFERDGVQTGGMMKRPAELPMPYWGFYFRVESIGKAVERLKTGGGQVLMGPHQVPGGFWIVNAMDPQGAHFALISDNE
jgi:predicted enzyme related to lactoylglutathione lyase